MGELRVACFTASPPVPLPPMVVAMSPRHVRDQGSQSPLPQPTLWAGAREQAGQNLHLLGEILPALLAWPLLHRSAPTPLQAALAHQPWEPEGSEGSRVLNAAAAALGGSASGEELGSEC